jgi:hypothetical protein
MGLISFLAPSCTKISPKFMSRHPFLALVLLIASGMLAASCTEDPLYPARSITVNGADMPSLVGDAVYELWLSYPPERAVRKEPVIDHDEPLYFSAGRFIVSDGAIRAVGGGPADFAIPTGYNPSLVFEAIVSVEPLVDDDTVPDAPMLWGRFTGTASRAHALLEAATVRTFDTAAMLARNGSFVLEAPTSEDAADSLSGIWFLSKVRSPGGDPMSPGVDMPALPLNHDNDNWIYEAWLTQRDGAGSVSYVSLGRFRNPANADLTGPGPAAGPNRTAAHGFPGEDFVAPRRVLTDSAYGVVVSLQPESIAVAAPVLRLLERPIIGDSVVSGRRVNMTATAKLPLVEVTIDR